MIKQGTNKGLYFKRLKRAILGYNDKRLFYAGNIKAKNTPTAINSIDRDKCINFNI